MRSAWIKWARAVEHQKVLARTVREFVASRDLFTYEQLNNAGDSGDPLLRMHWRIRDLPEYPERWGVLLGDAVTNFRAALDHAFWAAAVAHSGTPSKPQLLNFPIARSRDQFDSRGILQSLVAENIWEIVEAAQPFHGGDRAHTAPLEVLRWLSNVDKHRVVHVVSCVAVDLGPVLVGSAPGTAVMEDYRAVGPVKNGDVVGRLKLKRAVGGVYTLDVVPSFGFTMSIPIADAPEEHRSLHSAMEVIQEEVLSVLVALTDQLGASYPEDLELGAEHDHVAAEFGGVTLRFRDADGTVHRRNIDE